MCCTGLVAVAGRRTAPGFWARAPCALEGVYHDRLPFGTSKKGLYKLKHTREDYEEDMWSTG
jgi:hypothetical protein